MLPQISVDLFRTCPTSIRQYRKMWMRTRMFYTTISWRFVSIDQFTVNINCLNYELLANLTHRFHHHFHHHLHRRRHHHHHHDHHQQHYHHRHCHVTVVTITITISTPTTVLPLLIIIVVVIYVIIISSNRGSIFIILEKYFKMLYWMKRNLNSS